MNDPKSMSCKEFQEQLAELVGSGADVENHPHLKNCELCKALLKDLQAIADAARSLFQASEPEPESDLWNRIETEIKKEDAGLSKGD